MTNPTAVQPDSGASTPYPRQMPEIVEYEVEDEIVLYDPRHDSVHTLNPTAAIVWWLCDGEHDVKEIGRELADLYEVDPNDGLLRDAEDAVDRFRVAGLIRLK